MTTGAMTVAVLTVSDGVAAGVRADASGDAIAGWASRRGATVLRPAAVADDGGAITTALLRLADDARADVIITTGGTGLTARDVTPEATRAVLERDVPGIAQRLRAVGQETTPYAALSRGVAGVRGRTLIVNLPGSTGGVVDGLRVLDPIIDHAVQLLRGVDTEQHLPARERPDT